MESYLNDLVCPFSRKTFNTFAICGTCRSPSENADGWTFYLFFWNDKEQQNTIKLWSFLGIFVREEKKCVLLLLLVQSERIKFVFSWCCMQCVTYFEMEIQFSFLNWLETENSVCLKLSSDFKLNIHEQKLHNYYHSFFVSDWCEWACLKCFFYIIFTCFVLFRKL